MTIEFRNGSEQFARLFAWAGLRSVANEGFDEACEGGDVVIECPRDVFEVDVADLTTKN